MKKLLALLLCAALLTALAACGQSKEPAPEEESAETTEAAETAETDAVPEENAPLLGGWEAAESPVVPDDVKALLEQAAESRTEATYIPVAYLASQVVAGRNHAILCRMLPNGADAVETYAIVYLYADLSGNGEITGVDASAVETNIAGLAGGWEQAQDPTIPDDLAALLDQAFQSLLGVDYVPLALLSTQVVSGMNYCVLCEATVVSPDAAPEYVFVYLYEDLEGSGEITDIVNFAGDPAEG